MTDITIKYDHGQMLIHLDRFLSDGKITKVRKLLKLIRQSYTPECEEQIKEYIQQCGVTDKDKFHNSQVALAGKITNIKSNIYILENRLKAATFNRNMLKKSTPKSEMERMIDESPKDQKIINTSKTVNLSQGLKIQFVNIYKDTRSYERHTKGWNVRGHYRHYKSGKTVYIKPFCKGECNIYDKKYSITI